ncbi:SDR family oxidoreductase [Oceanibacterium hippocampi]|uniref:Putative 2,4-dienoyl-CoA reductase n=1 Tax=Oceanibacterium hippocampi TaxID=745714 RepID=A0A1Y5TG51_9PROT|nr:SDR family oxidoreductase [Oceanibacterium hippocampi]SLN59647.1 putative 2,4-dienoyl-CoA reductase [Oceanibacterium hippocampi]
MFRDDLLKGKRYLVTGGGTGLGRVMSERLLELGAEVAICGRRRQVLEDAAAEMSEKTGGRVTAHQVDIRVAEAVDEMVGEIWQGGPLDGLLNNAAGNFISRTEDLSPRGFDAIANIVLHGTFYVTSACGRRWIAEGRPGNVLSILTTWVWTGSPFVVPSAMSKSGVKAMTQSLAVEWGPKNIRLNAIAPGPFPTEGAWKRLRPQGSSEVRSDMTHRIPLRRVGKMSELSNLAVFLLSDESGYITGEVVNIDGGQWLVSAGGFADLWALDDAQWHSIRDTIKAANEQDKSRRG